ncbi:hypothetical protein [Muribaculum intestinale]|uniref:hypothetical protein n=1 Tax=Muribaculum intestinale TaxID=1796646 RepID=UPI003F669AE9
MRDTTGTAPSARLRRHNHRQDQRQCQRNHYRDSCRRRWQCRGSDRQRRRHIHTPHPEGSTQTIVTLNVSAKEGVVVFHDTYTLRLYRIGDHHHQRSHYRRGRCSAELLAALNASGTDVTATLSDWIFTAEPTIVAKHSPTTAK